MQASLSHIISQPRFNKAKFNLYLHRAATLNGSNGNCIFVIITKYALRVDEGYFLVRKAYFASIAHPVEAGHTRPGAWVESLQSNIRYILGLFTLFRLD